MALLIGGKTLPETKVDKDAKSCLALALRITLSVAKGLFFVGMRFFAVLRRLRMTLEKPYNAAAKSCPNSRTGL